MGLTLRLAPPEDVILAVVDITFVTLSGNNNNNNNNKYNNNYKC